jgi:RimJ/RimL family protein N-acetyltransferase
VSPDLRWAEEQPTLTGEKVRLRPWRETDAPAVYEACQDPEVQRYTTVPVPYLRRHAELYVASGATAWAAHEAASFAVTGPDSDDVLGSVAVMRINADSQVGEVGYWVAPWARGRGVATEAVILVSQWMRDAGFFRAELLIAVGNAASGAVAKAAGYEHEGVMRGRLVLRGVRYDIAVHAALIGE